MRARRGSEDWPVHVFVRYRFALQAAVDMLLWGPALFLATWARYDFQLDSVNLAGIGLLACVAGAAQVVVGARWGLYIHRWRYGTIDEVAALGRTVVVVTTLVALLNRFVFGHAIPISASIAGGFVALVLMAMVRYGWRILLDRALRPDDESAERVVVLGAGDGGHQTVTAMLTNPDSPYLPVAVLEDHPDRQKMRLRGVPVLGTRDDFERVVDETGATVLVIAIPSAGGELIREMAGRADALGIRTRVLPPVNELFGAVIGVADIRPVTEVDLLGRHEIDTDLHAVADYVAGKRVLITGAGGSIGSELCRQVNLFAPSELIMLDRDESALHSVQLSLEGRAMLDDPNLVVADLRDAERMDEVFALHRPDVVFHAAALKHLPLLEMHPAEGYKTNVWGTQNVLEAAARQRRRAIRQRLHRQGGRPHLGAGPDQAPGRAAHRSRRQAARRDLPLRAIRQRPRVQGIGAPRLPGPDRSRRPGHGHPSRRDPVLHDGRGGGAARHPGRRHRRRRRSPGSRHG